MAIAFSPTKTTSEKVVFYYRFQVEQLLDKGKAKTFTAISSPLKNGTTKKPLDRVA